MDDDVLKRVVFAPANSTANIRRPKLDDLLDYGVFSVLVGDDSMELAKICAGSVAFVQPRNFYPNGTAVYVAWHGEFLIRLLQRSKGNIVLKPRNDKYKDIVIGPDVKHELNIYGEIILSLFFHCNPSPKQQRILNQLTSHRKY
jgi:SOS-response transcriptional repressor LexA